MIQKNKTVSLVISALTALFLWTMTCTNISTFYVDFEDVGFKADYFTIALIGSALIFVLGAIKFNLNKKAALTVGIIVYIAAIFGSMYISVLFSGGFGRISYLFWVNTAFYLAVAAAALVISGSLRASAISAVVFSTLFNGISFVVYCFRGSSLTPTDLISFGTAMNVISQYSFQVKHEMFAAIAVAVPLIMLAVKFPIKLNFKFKWAVMRAAGAGVLGLAVLFIVGVDNSKYEISVYDQHYANMHFGSAYSFYVNTTKLGLNRREEYDSEKLNEKLMSYVQTVEEPQKKPNVIVIMNESFADLGVIGEFETNVDYMPYLNRLNRNVIKGEALVSPFGGYTCNSEYEFLTGMSTGVLNNQSAPYMQMMFGYMPYSLPQHMKQLGYYTMAMHPYTADSWNRENVYEYMGFDEFVSIDELKKYSKYPEYLRGYVSDKGNYGAILNYLYTDKDDSPVFIFDITMQNHGGYTFEEFETEVYPLNMKGSYPKTEQYLTLIKHSDEAVEYLLESLKKFDEPTVVVMFGDHHPGVEREFYEELYGASLDSLTYSELYKRYIVPFFVWANYDIEADTEAKTSPCYLSNIMMEAAGLPKSRVQLYLDELRSNIVQINPMCYFDKDGELHLHSESSSLDEFYDLQYSMLTGEALNYDFYDFSGSNKLSAPVIAPLKQQ